MPRLTQEQWEEIGRRYEAGEGMGRLAPEFGVSRQALSNGLHDRGVRIRSVGETMRLNAARKQSDEAR